MRTGDGVEYLELEDRFGDATVEIRASQNAENGWVTLEWPCGEQYDVLLESLIERVQAVSRAYRLVGSRVAIELDGCLDVEGYWIWMQAEEFVAAGDDIHNAAAEFDLNYLLRTLRSARKLVKDPA